MQLRDGISSVHPEDFPRMVEVWEASVRATHHFVSEEDIQLFKTLLLDVFRQTSELACVRDAEGEVAGFVGVTEDDLGMLFIHPACRGHGAGRRLVEHAVSRLGARRLDVNEQNEQAVGFYLRMGFEVAGRSALDGMGKPYPLLHMRLREPEGSA